MNPNLQVQRVRVFFALWPDAGAARCLSAIAQQWHGCLGGRVMREDSLHLTLVFIGDMAVERLPALLDSVANIQLPRFSVMFDHPGCWPHNDIAYLGMRQIPAPLLHLQSELAICVRAKGFQVERRAFYPHITLLRKTNCRQPDCAGAKKENPTTEPVAWAVRDFVLVKSSISANGSRYEQIGHWPLL